MRAWRRAAVLALLASVLAVVAWAVVSPRPVRPPPRAVEGAIDLRAWSFEVDGPASLEGEWDFFPGRLLEGDGAEDERAPLRSKVPGSWRDALPAERGRGPGAGMGYGTYRLRVTLPSAAQAPLAAYAIASRSPYSASKVLIRDGGRTLLSTPVRSGFVGVTEATSVPLIRRTYAEFPRTAELLLFVQVSDFHLDLGGQGEAPILGAPEDVRDAERARRGRDFFLIGAMVVIALFHFALYLLRPAERAPLWFGLHCSAMVLLTFFSNHHFETVRSEVWVTYLSGMAQDVGLYGGTVAQVLFIDSLFPTYTPRRLVRAFAAASVVAAAVALSGGQLTSQLVERVYLGAIPVVVAWIAYVLLRTYVRERDPRALVILAGYGAFVAVTFQEVLSLISGHPTAVTFHYGVFAFIVAQSVAIAIQNERARTAAEVYAARLDLAHAELTAKNAELDAKNAALSRLDQLKDAFLANTSHELRTPLHGIVGLVEALLEGSAGAVSAALRGPLQTVLVSARRLTTLVNDILDFAKLKHGALTLRPKGVDVWAAADVAIALASPLVRKKPVALRSDVPRDLPLVLADEDRLQQILSNLIGNAVKFTEQGEVIVSAREEGGTIAVSVTDTGIGIAEEHQARIFESFEQADGSMARRYGGTGLGLAISRQLVLLHGGALHVESEVGRGSRFTFTIPTVVAASSASRAARPEGAPRARLASFDSAPMPSVAPEIGRRFRVLAVDDDSVNLAVVVHQLVGAHFDVVKAESGMTALAAMKDRGPFDVVLLDVMMPKMTGYEVCRRIREVHPAHELPVILLTAKSQPADVVEGFAAGANDYLAKPFSKAELLARIVNHTAISRTTLSFGRFVPREFLRLLGKAGVVDVSLGDHVRCELAILFADIRAFTQLSESMVPEDTFAFINGLMGRFGPVVRDTGGFIDKFLGDGVMALFPHGAGDATRAAVAMLKEVERHNAESGVGRSPVAVGIGVHWGSVVLGTVGEVQRMEGTVIADAVNLASRIEGATKRFGVNLLLSREAMASMAEPPRKSRYLGRVRVRGRSLPVDLYEIYEGDDGALVAAKDDTREDFERAVKLAAEGHVAEARDLFAAIVRKVPGDGAASHYLRRFTERTSLTPPSWDGTLRDDE